jgi:hypothetical protein
MKTQTCEDRDRLLDLLLVAAEAHNNAVQAMSGREGQVLEFVRKWVANSAATYEDCREVFVAHEGCADAIATTA